MATPADTPRPPDPEAEPLWDSPLLGRVRASVEANDAAIQVQGIEAARADLRRRIVAREHGKPEWSAPVSRNGGRLGMGIGQRAVFLRQPLPQRLFSTQSLHLRGVLGAGKYTRLATVCAVMLLGFGTFLFRYSTPSVVHHYVTASGQRSIVRWDDGSTMQLAPSTAVDVMAHHVRIRGEAYFRIAPNASRPFAVQTSNAIVQVLGTTFSVRQYLGESQSRVVVEDGKVALRVFGGTSGARTILAAGTMARTTDSTIHVTPGIAVSDYTGWTRGSLVFNNVALGDLLEELSRAYGVNIRVADTALARHQMTMQVLVNTQSLPRVLDLIGMVANAHYTVDGKTYVLSPGRPSIHASPHMSFPQPEKQYGR